MAIWTDNTKCLWIGRSGLQYRRSMPCTVPSDNAASIATRFFISRGAVPDDGCDGRSMTFTRGSDWISRFSWILPLSETWPRQMIAVSIKQQDGTAMVEVSYDVRMIFTFLLAPNAVVKEARELERLLGPT